MNAYIFNIIMYKFRYQQKPGIIVIIEINKDSEIRSYYAILFFNLAITLWIKYCKKPAFDT